MRRFEIIASSLSKDTIPLPPPGVSEKALSEGIRLFKIICFPELVASSSNESETRLVLLRRAVEELSEIISNEIRKAFQLLAHEKRYFPSSKDEDGMTRIPRDIDEQSRQLADQFVDTLPSLQALLNADMMALYEHDVAATSRIEVVVCYPSVTVMLHYRMANQLYRLGAPNLLTRRLTEMAHCLTGVDIHPQTTIGRSFFLDHGTGVVIGSTAVIGDRVSVYQGVTLGARAFQVDETTGKKLKFLPRHPIIEDDVTIYANASVLGRITIGKGSIIGGSVWVTSNVPPNTTLVQGSARRVPRNKIFELSFVDGEGI